MTDLISRQAAIDVLNVGAELLNRVLDDADIVGVERAKYEWGLGLIESYIYDMKELPSAQQWIPCSERLPDDFYVLCCDDYGEMLIANPFECDDSDTGFSAESEDCYMYNCIAWMPLPEPYKGEEL